ncbi:tyrosine-type recombinase/integrase [Aurantimonas sp. VKM B-3413]|uniref:DUF6538 domain-containing protein n=1 Tax=Aurantimonas sp. VKM B-3413 TaxID=2779401 RepID=UPI001E291204|nr:tyrosine-type recombinase/integrase [Aurantimonas sp. VKM B-3413]MCB8840042.1 tyrosine-type recombinase/integrase [Aurantimonas sp. VKM B-3413]
MTRPTTRENSSSAQFRRRVPTDIAARARGEYFQVEVPASSSSPAITFTARAGIYLKFSLRTRDPAVASYRLSVANSQAERWFDALRREPSGLSHKMLVALSGEIYRLYVDKFEENPGSSDQWAALKAFNRAAREGRLLNDVPVLSAGEIDPAGAAAERFGENLTAGVNALPKRDEVSGLERRYGLLASWVLQKHCLVVDHDTRARLLVQVDQALTDAALTLKRHARGDYSPDPKAARFPVFSKSTGAVSLDGLFEKWAEEVKPAASTLSTWRGVVRNLSLHLGGKANDIRQINPEDIVAWKDKAVANGRSAKTVNDSYLGCAKTLFSYACRNRLLVENPADGVRVARKSQAGTSMLPYADEEVARLLTLAAKEERADRRWLPLLLACTGARVGELAQLWGKRVVEKEGLHVLKIAPAEDGGSLKNEGSEREVPLHPDLVSSGFLDFVKAKGDGPLFYRRSSGKAGRKHASKGVTNRLAAWIREQGFRDRRKAPNHAFRHWFKTVAIRVGVADSIADTIQGHVTAGEASKYRHADLKSLADAVARIPIPPC